MHSCFEGVPWPRHLERLLDLALAVPLGIVRVCLEHSERDHQTQSDAIRRNHDYLDHLEGGRGLVHRYEGRPKRRIPDEGGNQTSLE
jgi:hypothetical protein